MKIHNFLCLRFQVVMAASIKMTFFSNVVSHSTAETDRGLRRPATSIMAQAAKATEMSITFYFHGYTFLFIVS